MIFPEKIVYRVHALKRMFERNITTNEIKLVLQNSKVVRAYEDDTPFPSYLAGVYKLGNADWRKILIHNNLNTCCVLPTR